MITAHIESLVQRASLLRNETCLSAVTYITGTSKDAARLLFLLGYCSIVSWYITELSTE